MDLDLEVSGVLTVELGQILDAGEVIHLAVEPLGQSQDLVLAIREVVAVGDDQNARGWVAWDRLRLGLHSQFFLNSNLLAARIPTGYASSAPPAFRGEGLEALPKTRCV